MMQKINSLSFSNVITAHFNFDERELQRPSNPWI